MFIGLLSIFTIKCYSKLLPSNYIKPVVCVYPYNQPCEARSILVDINSTKNIFYPFTVSINKCGGSCNTVDDLYERVCLLNKVKIVNVKVFSIMSRVKETRFLIQNETKLCGPKCGLNKSGCNSKQKWNHNERWCQYKELDDCCSCQND